MKKIFLCASVLAALTLGSCSSVKHTSTTLDVATNVCSQSTADLQVSPNKISFTYIPSQEVLRGGDVVATAVAAALHENGNADVLVAPQYEIKRKGKKIQYVIVEGYPACYTNVRSANPCPGPAPCPGNPVTLPAPPGVFVAPVPPAAN